MSFSFKCNHCGAAIQAEESWAGGQTTCPQCGQTVTIPPPIGLHPSHTPAPPPPSKLPQATSAVIWGVITLLLSPFFVIAIIPGVIALFKGISALLIISKSDGQLRGKGKAITGIVLVICAFLISCFIISWLNANRKIAMSMSCTSNMKELYGGMLVFSSDKGRIPNSAECMNNPDSASQTKLANYLASGKNCFKCPESMSAPSYRFFVNGEKCDKIGKIITPTPSNKTILAVCENNHLITPLSIFDALALQKHPIKAIIVVEASKKQKYTHILFADGHIASHKKSEVEAAIQNATPGTMPVLK